MKYLVVFNTIICIAVVVKFLISIPKKYFYISFGDIDNSYIHVMKILHKDQYSRTAESIFAIPYPKKYLTKVAEYASVMSKFIMKRRKNYGK